MRVHPSELNKVLQAPMYPDGQNTRAVGTRNFSVTSRPAAMRLHTKEELGVDGGRNCSVIPFFKSSIINIL
jgi:hypothetical protein